MARSKISTAAADPVRDYLESVAKSLVERLYGKDGPAWGTNLSEIEETILALRQVLSENMLNEALQRQANTSSQRPQELQNCPKCGQQVEDKPPPETDKRLLQTCVGEAKWQEPETYCRKCRRAFFPSNQELGDRSQ